MNPSELESTHFYSAVKLDVGYFETAAWLDDCSS